MAIEDNGYTEAWMFADDTGGWIEGDDSWNAVVPTGAVGTFDIEVIARREETGDYAHWKLSGTYSRLSDPVTVMFTKLVEDKSNMLSCTHWDVEMVPMGNDKINLRCKGDNGHMVHWFYSGQMGGCTI